MSWILKILVVFCILLGLNGIEETRGESLMKLTSSEFENNKFIPDRFTCAGEDINPSLTIEDIPAAAKSLALILDDPDAPGGMWVHWVVYDIPLISRIEENSIPGKEGTNDFGRQSYGGPCPPSGAHRYFFKLYALDAILNLKEGLTKAELERAMAGHILAKAGLVGLYERRK